MRVAGRRYLAKRPHSGVWFRAIPPEFFSDGLGFEHTISTPTRFNPGGVKGAGFPILYFTEDPHVALTEVRAIFLTGTPHLPVVPNPATGPRTVFAVHVELRGIVDLCDPTQLQLLDTSVQELTGDWQGYALRTPLRPAPTQQLGAALFATPRVEGFLTYSARQPTRRSLAVFPTKLRPGSSIAVSDPATGQVQMRLP